MTSPTLPIALPNAFGSGAATWLKSAACYVYQDGFPVWLDGRRIWGVVGGAWQLLPDTVEYRRYYLGRDTARLAARGKANPRGVLRNGLYALAGPSIRNNPYELDVHILIAQFQVEAFSTPLTLADTQAYFERYPVYGLAWKATKGRVVVAKREQFGLPWPDLALLALMHSKGGEIQ